MVDHSPAPTLTETRRVLYDQGYVVLPQAVEPAAVATALRRLNLAIREHGISAEQIAQWQLATFFPHLRWEPELWGALPPAAAELLGWQEGDTWGDPQILLRFPDADQPWTLEPHTDTLPPGQEHRAYRGIVGVALTRSHAQDGTICVWPRSHVGESEPMTPIDLEAGDAIVFHPELGHTGSLNLGETVRTALYFRLLTGEPTLGA
jgi:ectoine hydroxylase-related dioxygenase (phytanoyl-CoA dioxygenase family)